MLFKKTTTLVIIIFLITSFPIKKTVFPLNGYLSIDSEESVISIPQTVIWLATKNSFAAFKVSKT